MDWVAIIGIMGIPAVMSSVIPFLITRHYTSKDKKEERLEATKERLSCLELNHDKINQELNDIKEILIILKNAEQAILRDRLIQMYNHYYKDKGFMPIYARESLLQMYKEYHNLNGNGVIEDLVKKILTLPTDPPSLDE